ncbi:hypothetical protein DFH06DRAFT_433610 [Mycena polygramma]|nr:hypothetical protein DFH06DRAFT_433610 [Mycena polygramma]
MFNNMSVVKCQSAGGKSIPTDRCIGLVLILLVLTPSQAEPSSTNNNKCFRRYTKELAGAFICYWPSRATENLVLHIGTDIKRLRSFFGFISAQTSLICHEDYSHPKTMSIIRCSPTSSREANQNY